MDRSLWLLHGLRLRGKLRQWGRAARTFKGLLAAALGAFMLAMLLASFWLAPRVMVSAQLGLIRHSGAPGNVPGAPL